MEGGEASAEDGIWCAVMCCENQAERQKEQESREDLEETVATLGRLQVKRGLTYFSLTHRRTICRSVSALS